MKKRSFIVITLTLTLLSVSLAGCTNPFAKKEEKEETELILDVNTAKPVIRDMSINSEFAATVEADSSVMVIPKVAGEVIEKNFEVGDHVNEGELLFAIDDEAYQIAMKQAQATLTTARSSYTAQQASTALANIAGVETIGKMPTTDQQMSNAIDSAYAQAVVAGNNLDTAGASNEYYKKQLDELREDLDDAEDEKDAAKKAGDEVAYATAKAKVETIEDAIEQMELTVRTNGNTAENAEMNYYVAQEGVDMAIRQKQDYDLYTKSTTLYGVNNSVVGAESALTNAQQTIKQAEAGVENAQMALDNTKVTAPVSGTITEINVSLHNMASQSQVAYVIESDAKNKIVFYIAEETARSVKPGNTAIVRKSGEIYPAKITTVNETLDSTTGLFKVEAAADTDTLLTGSDVSIQTTTRHSKNALSVPVNSVYYDKEQAYVLVNENGIAARKNVTTGLSNEDMIEITEGIDADTDVIITYSTQLKDGVKLNANTSSEGKTEGK